MNGAPATYRWKPNVPSFFTRLDAQEIGEELDRLEQEHQHKLSADEIVRAASTPQSPLNPVFEWDDEKAAHHYRVHQARQLIATIDIVVTRPDDTTMPIRAFVSVTSDEGRGYTSTVHALSDPDLRRQVIDRAWMELDAWRQRHAELVEFGKFFALIDKARRPPK